ncbi:MAG: hypothetical protein MUF87_16740 [Anaerolineae bacterium]|jgi:hypothetical protein|nr:hypothetical protein [Anaerolineae bacterium]
MTSKFKWLSGLTLIAILLALAVLLAMRFAPSIDAQSITRSAILEQGLETAIRFGLEVDPLRSEPYLTQVIETTYEKWSRWRHATFTGMPGEEQRPFLVLVYTGEITYYFQSVEMHFDRLVMAYALDTGEYQGGAHVPATATLDFSPLR